MPLSSSLALYSAAGQTPLFSLATKDTPKTLSIFQATKDNTKDLSTFLAATEVGAPPRKVLWNQFK
ncbi:hypothetical protein AMTR_s00052p00099240 [Amborella trichopoda]|uniref:Uncharacterized protein n=1 Tax=Amborella trichopoda TaxID=13333 RepID=U5D2A5_AMBTC|nr:hypothetical protein AMTR_s00052p00099240 [Amborella trichopoda]